MSIHTRKEPKPIKTEKSVEILPVAMKILEKNYLNSLDPSVKMLMDGMRARMKQGEETYGQGLVSADGRNNWVDWWQEAVDQVTYGFKAAIENSDDDGVVDGKVRDLLESGMAFALCLADYLREHKIS